jgi:pimeloyl-ACP methyl ester carboxylesterase
MRPVYFDGCFGWLHPAGGTRGVVLCSPFGPEADYVHRAWRDLAEELASAGITALRFDYRGTRDSADLDGSSRPLRAWIDSIKAAARWLKHEVGVEDVVLLGMRLGGALAVACAEELGGIGTLVLLAPVVSGRTYCREMAMLARAGRRRKREANDLLLDSVLPPEVVEDVQRLEICNTRVRLARRMLILWRPNVPRDRNLTGVLRAMGTQLEEEDFLGYTALLVNPDFAVYPAIDFRKVVDWLRADLTAASLASRAIVPPDATAHLALPVAHETGMFFRPAAPLFGIVCSPLRKRRELPALVFLNTSGISRAGMNRIWVSMARRFACLGFTSLRFDLAGIGDSPRRPGQRDPRFHMDGAFADVAAAIDWLHAQGHPSVTLIGFCWGAQLACNVALSGIPVSGVVLINPRRLFWTVEVSSRSARGFGHYLRMAHDPATWRKLMRGGVSVASVVEIPSNLIRSRHSVVRRLRSLRARRVETLLIHGQHDISLFELQEYFSVPRDELGALLDMKTRFIEGVDHMFRTEQAVAGLQDAIAKHLFEGTSAAEVTVVGHANDGSTTEGGVPGLRH